MPFRSISSFLPPYIYIPRLPPIFPSFRKILKFIIRLKFLHPSVYSVRQLFRNREIAFEADAYYHWMHNYSAVPIISIILINQAVSEWNVRTNVRVSRPMHMQQTSVSPICYFNFYARLH